MNRSIEYETCPQTLLPLTKACDKMSQVRLYDEKNEIPVGGAYLWFYYGVRMLNVSLYINTPLNGSLVIRFEDDVLGSVPAESVVCLLSDFHDERDF